MSPRTNLEPALVLRGLGRRILLVDDDPIQGRLVEAQLTAVGFAVDLVAGARAALVALRHSRPDAIVSDVLMDEVDGFSLCRILRRDASFASVPIILLTAYFDEAPDRLLADEVGATALVERSPDLRAGIEAIVENLADDARPSSTLVTNASYDLYAHRVAHRLARLQKTASAAEARYQALFEHAHDAFSILSADGTILEVNRRFAELMQLPREVLVGRRLRDLGRGDDDSRLGRYRQAHGVDSSRTGPLPFVRRDGSTIYVEFTTTTTLSMGSQSILSVGRDVTELVLARKKLEASERRYRSLIQNMPDVLWSATTDGELTFVSPSVSKITGFTEAEILVGAAGSPMSRIHPDDRRRFRAAFAAAVTDRVPLDAEYRCMHREGRWLWIHCRAIATVDPDGTSIIDGIFSDVTERKLLEEQLCQAQKVEAIGQLTAGIAHDFNNILAAIQVNADFLAREHADCEAGEVAREIGDASQRGIALTSRLLAFSRREAVDASPLDLNQVVDRISPMISRTLGSRFKVRVAREAELGTICADAAQLEQVLMNLAVNARDAMPKGGELTITTANVERDGSETDAENSPEPGRYVSLAVKDTGCGMAPATRERLFEPFFTTKEKGRGTGLGLSTSYGIVRRWSGHVSVDSAPGAGTTFTFLFPRIEGAPAAAATAAAAALRVFENGEERTAPRPSAAPPEDPADRPIPGMPFPVRDDVRARLDELVRERTSELEAANLELESFSYAVSHDLRGPIRAIQGFTQAALDDAGPAVDGDVRRHLVRVKEAALRMSDLTDALLELSRVTRTKVERAAVDVTALVHGLARDLRELDPVRDVRIVVEDGIVTEADPRLLRVMLENLMTNAWKFTQRKPAATIEVRRGAGGEIVVRDNGEGFDPRNADRIFEPFQRLSPSNTFRGTGIGLATVMRIVRRHGGRIRAESIPGEGAAFHFALHLA